jgi:NAD+ kinase
MKVALIGNTYQAEKNKYLESIIEALSRRNVEVVVERKFLHFITQVLNIECSGMVAFDETDFSADLCISIGGDGTFLQAAAYVGNKSIPIIGINTGHLGFLADVPPNLIEEAFHSLWNGEYIVE